MKTPSTANSHQPHDSSTFATNANADWKRQFRLSALDLNPLLQTEGDNVAWVSHEPWLQRTLDLVRGEVAELNVWIEIAGEELFPTDTRTLLFMLGMAAPKRPDSTVEKFKFAWRLLIGLLKFHHRAMVLRATLRSMSPVSVRT
jgi:hypothetical protein